MYCTRTTPSTARQCAVRAEAEKRRSREIACVLAPCARDVSRGTEKICNMYIQPRPPSRNIAGETYSYAARPIYCTDYHYAYSCKPYTRRYSVDTYAALVCTLCTTSWSCALPQTPPARPRDMPSQNRNTTHSAHNDSRHTWTRAATLTSRHSAPRGERNPTEPNPCYTRVYRGAGRVLRPPPRE